MKTGTQGTIQARANCATGAMRQPVIARKTGSLTKTEIHIAAPAQTKPLEVWVNVYHDGLLAAYASKECAATFISKGGRTVHMREVADDDS